MKTPYDVILEPVLTEKSIVMRENENKYTFKVHPKANKIEIRDAIQKIYDVKVESVAVMNKLGKMKRVRVALGRRPSWKKAVVKLIDGQKIDME